MHQDPFNTVKEFLKKMGMEERFRDKVFTSGEAALNYLKKFYSSKKILSYRSTKRF